MKKCLSVLAIASAIMFSACGGATPPPSTPAPAPEVAVSPAPAQVPAMAPVTDTASAEVASPAMTGEQTGEMKPAGTAQKYTCPMHPEVMMADAKAKCPKCGMNLVPAKNGG